MLHLHRTNYCNTHFSPPFEFDKEYLPMQPGDVHTTYADINLTKSELDWEPKIEIKEGLTEFYDWYKEYYK